MKSKTLKQTLSDWHLLLLLAGARLLFHLLTNGQYGFHRDALAFLDNGQHLAWGYVAYPPLTPFVGRIGLALFGLIKGADASRQLRAAVMKQVGYFGGLVMATITDNEGSRLVVKQADLNDNKLPPVRVRPDLLKGGRS